MIKDTGCQAEQICSGTGGGWHRSPASHPQERLEPGSYLVKHLGRYGCDVVAASFLPSGALHMIGQDNALHRQVVGKGHLESISLRMLCHRTHQTKPDLRVVRARRQNQPRAPAPLLAAGLWCEGQPDQIASVGNVRTVTTPCARRLEPQSVSPWMFSGLICLSNSSSVYSGFRGLSSKPLATRVTSSSVPSSSSSSLA